jgi:hypothetical protein
MSASIDAGGWLQDRSDRTVNVSGGKVAFQEAKDSISRDNAAYTCNLVRLHRGSDLHQLVRRAVGQSAKLVQDTLG